MAGVKAYPAGAKATWVPLGATWINRDHPRAPASSVRKWSIWSLHLQSCWPHWCMLDRCLLGLVSDLVVQRRAALCTTLSIVIVSLCISRPRLIARFHTTGTRRLESLCQSCSETCPKPCSNTAILRRPCVPWLHTFKHPSEQLFAVGTLALAHVVTPVSN